MQKKRTVSRKSTQNKGDGDENTPHIHKTKDGIVSIEVSQETMDKILGKNQLQVNQIGFHTSEVYLGEKSVSEVQKLKEEMPAGPFVIAADMDAEKERLKFDNGKLRTLLEMWTDYVQHDGNLYYVQVDPLNRVVKILGEGEGEQESERVNS